MLTIARPERLTTKETAAAVRLALKATFPGVKFGVRTDYFAGGSAVDVTFPADKVEASKVHALCASFQGIGFDGMTDSTTYTEKEVVFNGETRRAGYCYVHAQRAF